MMKDTISGILAFVHSILSPLTLTSSLSLLSNNSMGCGLDRCERMDGSARRARFGLDLAQQVSL